MTTATAKRIENKIASLQKEVAELRARITTTPSIDEDAVLLHNEMALWERASANDFNAFAIKNKA